jgi:hypothetical protein
VPDDEPEALPASIGGLFGTALRLYGRRFAGYTALSVGAIAVQFLVGVLAPHSTGSIIALSVIVDAAIVTTVAIGVASALYGRQASWSALLGAASLRWGVVAIAGFVYFLAVFALEGGVIGSPQQLGYGLFVAPIIVVWGAVWLAQVAAAIEPASSRLMLPFVAIGKAMTNSLALANLGRLFVLSVVLAAPMFAQQQLTNILTARHVHDPLFWGNVPLDALLAGPLTAISTLFYLDFARRVARKSRPG